MTLEQLRIFVAVAEREHVTRAAEALNLTQSAVSAAVTALETRHGVRLFDRVGRGIVLTQAGALFLIEARAILARTASAERVLAELAGLKRGVLNLYASQTISAYWLPARIAAFHRAHPGVKVTLEVGNTAQVAHAVLEGAVELGFVEGHVDEALLRQDEVSRDRLVVIVPPDHPWSDGHALDPHDLREAQWVLREPGSGTRSEFEAALSALGVSADALQIGLTLPSNESVRAAVEAGAGVTAISELVAASSLKSGTLRRGGFDLPERPFHAVRHRERYTGEAARAFMAMVADKAV